LLGPDQGTGADEAQVRGLCAEVAALGIVRDEHGLRGGPGVDRLLQYCCEYGELGATDQDYWCDEHGENWPPGVETPTRLSALGLHLAQAYRASRDAGQRKLLADAFLLLEDHLYDQGMQAGAGFDWNWWYGGSWADAVFLMRDVLAGAGRLARQCDYFLWNWGGEQILAAGDPRSDSDYFLLWVPLLMRACLLQPEPAEQVCLLRALKASLERSILQPAGALKIDGSAYHHGGHYFHYTFASMPGLAGTLLQLSGTPWRLSPEAHERVRRALLAQRIFCNQRNVPISLSGRMPFCSYSMSILPQGLDQIARCGSPDGKQAVDPVAAAAYLRLEPAAVRKGPYKSLGLEPEPEPNGAFVMPYAALLSYRRDNWLASIHGQSKYCWGTERQSKVNCFGLFQGLGALEIMAGGSPVSAEGSGREAEGWDWRHFEGTTAPQLPLERIDRELTSPYSPETFVGGLSHRGQQGIFAMVLNQPMPGQTVLAARKSWFFSENRVLFLASDLSCDEASYATETTLCQRRLTRDQQGAVLPTPVDGADLTGFPEEKALHPARAHWFIDVQQTGYILPAGQRVVIARRHQKCRTYDDQAESEGDFLTAWLDHGLSPAGAAYEYMLVVRATPAAIQGLAAEPPYRVLQRDRAAHIVWDTQGHRWNCVLFLPQELAARQIGAERLPLQAVDRPCLAVADVARTGELLLTVADPDLNLVDSVSQPRPLRVTLRGAWRLLEATGTLCAWPLPEASADVRVVSTTQDATVVEIICRHGASYGLRLVRG